MFMCAYVWSFVRVYARACVKMSVMAANTHAHSNRGRLGEKRKTEFRLCEDEMSASSVFE